MTNNEFYGPKVGGAWPATIGSLTGRTILNGSGAPLVGDGVAGDFYIDTDVFDIYGPKTTVWGAVTTLKGPQGDPGATGPQGIQGIKVSRDSRYSGSDGSPRGSWGNGGNRTSGSRGRGWEPDSSGSGVPPDLSAMIQTSILILIFLCSTVIRATSLLASGLLLERSMVGNNFFHGGAIPNSAVGAEGDYYIHTTTPLDLYGPEDRSYLARSYFYEGGPGGSWAYRAGRSLADSGEEVGSLQLSTEQWEITTSTTSPRKMHGPKQAIAPEWDSGFSIAGIPGLDGNTILHGTVGSCSWGWGKR